MQIKYHLGEDAIYIGDALLQFTTLHYHWNLSPWVLLNTPFSIYFSAPLPGV